MKPELSKWLDEEEKKKMEEIETTNLYLKRGDIPTWKVTALNERKNFLLAQVELIKEIREKMKNGRTLGNKA